jgi:hypothetical protein
MSLTLVTGPANAAKAGYVLERLREVLHREPLLVVPTAADVAHYQRELAAGEVVFGAEVLTFSRLWREIGRVAGVSARPLGMVARERVVRAAIRDAHLRVLAPSAAAPGFARRCTPPTAGAWRRSGAPTATARRGRCSTRSAPTRARGAGGLCSCTASTS